MHAYWQENKSAGVVTPAKTTVSGFRSPGKKCKIFCGMTIAQPIESALLVWVA